MDDNIAKIFKILVIPTGKITDHMALKFFPETIILLLHIYGFEGYSSRYKSDEMVNNHSNSCK